MEKMAEKFTEFVLKLAEDPGTLARFREDSLATMSAAGLTPAEQVVLASADATLIRNALAADIGAKAKFEAASHGFWPVYVVVAVTVAVAAVEGVEPDTEK
ncbi:hypothetical protein [Kitasatospora sp. NPDC096204]|uniref:hypothetical protein n=1 Tax=Kitasatospora sp. NPDC096204 TaxID=3364094 RepID=UPI00380BC14C